MLDSSSCQSHLPLTKQHTTLTTTTTMDAASSDDYPSVIALAWEVRHELCSAFDKPASSFSWPETRHAQSPFARASTPLPARRRAASIRRELLTTQPSSLPAPQHRQIPSAGTMKALQLQKQSQGKPHPASKRRSRRLPRLFAIAERR